MSGPSNDQVEINIFGPGFGESSAIHIGQGNWVLIDSCIDSETQKSAALGYLNRIGVDVASAVRLVIATHWHDDHIRGLGDLLLQCKSAHFCSSAALSRKEFIETVSAYNNKNSSIVSSGLSEIETVLQILRSRKSVRAIKALGTRKIFELPAGFASHAFPCDVFTLSPSDTQFDQSMINIAKLMPLAFTRKIRAPSPRPNDLSIVTWIAVGPIAMLFGADLEEHGKPDRGWAAVVDAIGLPTGRARIFKIPHHGSANGHLDEVWTKMLEPSPYAVLTPWNLNKGLPQISDVKRIQGYTALGYSTSTGKLSRIKKRSPAVEKTIRYSGITLNAAESKTGHVRIRNKGCAGFDDWEVDLSDNACRLNEILVAP